MTHKKLNILVTGGTGYIGSHTTVELLSAGHTVHIIDNLSNSDISMIERIEEITGHAPSFTELDMRNNDAVEKVLQDHSFDGVIHFAALKAVNESVDKPLYYYENNIVSFINLIQSMQKTNTNNLVFSSSCTVYGSPDKLPVTENTPIGHTPSPYGVTKQMSERILDDYSISNPDFKSISLRYFNPVGAHSSGLIGELPTGVPNNLMPYITQTGAGLRQELSVFGDDYDTHDGTAIRDYIHVSDLAEAHIRAIEYLFNQQDCQNLKINIGTGVGLSVMDVINSFIKTTGIDLKYKMAPRRQGDVEAIYADTQRAEQLLNWKAKYGVDDMTSSAWTWEKKLRKLD